MARPSGSNRGRLLLVMLIVSSLLLITLDLRGVAVVSGIRSGVGTALSPVETVGNWVVSPVKNFFSDLIHLGRTRSTINHLKEENAKLRAEIVQEQNAKGQSKQLQAALDLAGRASWKTVSAKVLAQGSTISFTHTVTIDQGSRAGIKPNLTVVNGSGLVGVVKTVFPNSSVVLLASDPAFKIGVRVARNQSIGILSGQGSNSGVLELLQARHLQKDCLILGLPDQFIEHAAPKAQRAMTFLDGPGIFLKTFEKLQTLDLVPKTKPKTKKAEKESSLALQ